MVPDGMGNPGAWVTLTSIAEIAIAIGLQIRSLAPWVAAAGVVMLCCLFPSQFESGSRASHNPQEAGSACGSPTADTAHIHRLVDRQCLAAPVNQNPQINGAGILQLRHLEQ